MYCIGREECATFDVPFLMVGTTQQHVHLNGKDVRVLCIDMCVCVCVCVLV